jgi:hypothetical protein
MNTNTSHPLIPNSQEYIVHKKYVSIHSEDIDTSKYTDNCFEIELPQDYLNVLSVKLTDVTLPPNIYNFSQALGNTTLYFDISLNPTDPTNLDPAGLQNVSLVAVIPDGFYYITGTTIQISTANYMNVAVNAYLSITTGGPITDYNNFNNILNTDSTIIIVNATGGYPSASFTLFNTAPYPVIPNNCTNILGCNTGQYPSTNATLYHDLGYVGKFTNSILQQNGNYYATSKNIPNYNTYANIYMEIEGLNNLDEIQPYGQNQYTRNNSGNSGIVNSAFAKIALSVQDSLTYPPFGKDLFYNYKYFNPPAERIRKLKIKFRYHNNVLVNFNGGSYTFLLEFTLYDNQPLRSYNLSRPVILI